MAIPTSNLSSTGLSNPINLKDGTSILQPGHPPGSTGRGRPRGVLLAWNSPGHQMMVSGSVREVASDIPGWLFTPMLDFDHSGDPKPGGGDAFESLEYLTKAEDFTFANAAGKCHIDVPGGQIIHFMRDAYQAERTAYELSLEHILSNGAEAAQLLQENIRFHFDHPIRDQMFTTPASFARIRKRLAAALHTLQDSFSKGHVERDDKLVIQRIHVWDKENKAHHSDDDSSWTSPPNANIWDPKPTDAAGIERSPLGKAAVAAGAELLRCVYRSARAGMGNSRSRFRHDSWGSWVPRFFTHVLPIGLRPAEEKERQQHEEQLRQEREERIEHNMMKR